MRLMEKDEELQQQRGGLTGIDGSIWLVCIKSDEGLDGRRTMNLETCKAHSH